MDASFAPVARLIHELYEFVTVTQAMMAAEA